MKFEKEIASKGLLLPISAARLAGFGDGDKVEFHPLKGTIVVLKRQMTAMELMNAAQSLHELSKQLIDHLANVCGQCDNCGEKDWDSCPLVDLDGEEIIVPDYLLEEAGIPEGAKLYAEANRGDHSIAIYLADYAHDLRDVPPDLMEILLASNVCLAELEEQLIREDNIYGG